MKYYKRILIFDVETNGLIPKNKGVAGAIYFIIKIYMNKINLTICGLILFFILLIGLYFVEKGGSLVKVNEGFNSTAAPNVPSGYTLKSGWVSNFYNAVGGDYITYQGNTLVLEKNGSLLLLEGNSPTGTNVI